MDADAVVVGAGPAGATTATLLAKAGARVVLLDRARFPRHKACAEYMSPGVVEALARLGLLESITPLSPRPVPGMTIISQRGRSFTVAYTKDGVARPAITLPRVDFDYALVQRAVKEGAQLAEGMTARRPLANGGTVHGVVAGESGRETVITGRLLVVADGARSVLRRELGLSRPVRWPGRLGLIAHYEGATELNSGSGQMHVFDGGYCGLAPLPGDAVNVGMVLRSGAARRARLSASQLLEATIARHSGLARALDGARRISSVRGLDPVGARARDCALPGVLLVGDAAGFFDPFTGEGIFRAISGGELAAQAALRLLAGEPASAVQPWYREARRKAFASKELVTRLVQVFVRFPRLLDYALPRLQSRSAGGTLSAVLGDIEPARSFLRLEPFWQALRP